MIKSTESIDLELYDKKFRDWDSVESSGSFSTLKALKML